MQGSAPARRIARFVSHLFLLLGASLWSLGTIRAAELSAAAATNDMVVILEIAGSADILPAGGTVWTNASVGRPLRLGDRFRTQARSRATLRLSDRSQLRVGELSELELREEPSGSPVHRLWRGVLYFFHRDKPGRFRFDTPGTSAAVRGTEFTLESAEGGVTLLTLFDGAVELNTPFGQATAISHQRILAEPAKAPVVTAVLEPELVDAIQWCLYYPAVLDPGDLGLRSDDAEGQAASASLAAYASGDLPGALRACPPAFASGSVRQQLYYAALLLSVGRVDGAREILERWQESRAPAVGQRTMGPLARALRSVIGVVRGEGVGSWTARPEAGDAAVTATEWLADSYVRQARMDLPGALKSARRAAKSAPDFGFTWVRVAELEFGFGETRRASDTLRRAEALSPRHAEALALGGFLRAATDDIPGALDRFARALSVDGGLGNAWLGRGLCRIRQGQIEQGLMDLQTAAVVEPRRSLFRSYLGKGYEAGHWSELARKELRLARELDPRDPTPWFFSALLEREQRRINDAVRDLERSKALNDQRALYRSRFLLDEDRAVRSSSLAELYEAVGMPEVGLREAVRAVSDDYANYSSHRFVAESFNALREPTRSNLRHETVWFSEWLLASLLAPPGGAPLAPPISLQEYSRLFEQDRLGLASSTEYRSDGQFGEIASQSGRLGGTTWSLDLDYEHHQGTRANQDLNRLEWYSTLQHRLSREDSVLLLVKYQDFRSGDVFQYYSPTNARPRYRLAEHQEPILLAGFRHEWRPGVQTLLAAARLQSELLVQDADASQWVRFLDASGQPLSFSPVGLDVAHRVELAVQGVEAQQIYENERHWLVAGARWQGGKFSTHSLMVRPSNYAADFPVPAAASALDEDLERVAAYGYETLKLPASLRLTGGVTYDSLRYPRNFRHPPLAAGGERRERVNPKAAVVWDALPCVTLRGAYLRSLGGVSLDESYRLEPTQLAGFVQDYRTLIPEALVSSVSAPDHEIAGIAADFNLATRTYVTVGAQRLVSEVDRSVGAFDYFLFDPVPPRIRSTQLRQHLDFEENTAGVRLRQLISREWSVGLWYSHTRAKLEVITPGLAGLAGTPQFGSEATLQELGGSLLYQHPSGVFARLDSRWYWQDNLGATAGLRGDSMQQLDVYAGYRMPWQRGDLTVGVLNLTGDDYRFQAVTMHPEFPRERVFYARVRLRF